MKLLLPILCLMLLLCAGSCYYDKESDLYPASTCDTASVKYSTTIQPIVQAQCSISGCHAGANAAGGIALTSYEGVRAIALDGSFSGTIEYQSGYPHMPQNRDKLPDCQISQIRIWTAAGAPNN